MVREELVEALQSIDDRAVVTVYEDRPPFRPFVVSPHFIGLDEGERQRQVWRIIVDRFTTEELPRVAFIFTDTPEERAEVERQIAANESNAATLGLPGDDST